MSVLRTMCPTCDQPHTLAADDVILHIGDDGVGRYVFACTLCGTTLSRALADRSLEVMLAAGARVIEPSSPQRKAQAPGPRLTLDDLLDLHELLATRDWFERLASMENAE